MGVRFRRREVIQGMADRPASNSFEIRRLDGGCGHSRALPHRLAKAR